MSKGKSYEAIGAYWDTHELPLPDAKLKRVNFAVDLRRKERGA